MGKLTDDMTRLRGEVDALRSDRGALMQELAHGAQELASTVSAMQADFAAAHASLTKQAREEREAFVAAVVDEVNSLLGGFSRDRDTMALEGQQDRQTFLSELKNQVENLRKAAADDLVGARLAWRGQIKRKPVTVLQKRKPVVVVPASPKVEENKIELNQEAKPVKVKKEKPVKVKKVRVPRPVKTVTAAPENIVNVQSAPETPAPAAPTIEAAKPLVATTLLQSNNETILLDQQPANTDSKNKTEQ